MAKYLRIPPFTGTEDLLCIYKMRGRYYVRRPSSLTGERVKTDPRFRNMMLHSDLLAKASPIGSKIYAALPPYGKQHSLYLKITGEAQKWLKYGWKEEDIIEFLLQKYKATQHCIPQVTAKEFSKKKPAQQPALWQPLTNRRSIKAFVRNMCAGKPARKNKQYDRYLAASLIPPI